MKNETVEVSLGEKVEQKFLIRSKNWEDWLTNQDSFGNGCGLFASD